MALALVWIVGAVIAAVSCRLAYARLLLSKAKHPSLQGHVRLAKRLARLVPRYEYDGGRFFDSDGAPCSVASTRRAAFDRLAEKLEARAARTIALGDQIEPALSDVQFTKHYR